MEVPARDGESISYPPFDEEMQRMLDERVRLELRCYADACEPEIRRDVEQRAQRILAQGGTREEACGTAEDPDLVAKMDDPPYLTKDEEAKIREHIPEEGIVVQTRKRATAAAIFCFLLIWASYSLYKITPPIAPTFIFILVLVAVLPWVLFNVFRLYLRKWAVDYFGPIGCALSDERVSKEIGLSYITGLMAMFFFLGSVFPLTLILGAAAIGGLGRATYRYFRARRRILENYAAASRILQIPGHDQL